MANKKIKEFDIFNASTDWSENNLLLITKWISGDVDGDRPNIVEEYKSITAGEVRDWIFSLISNGAGIDKAISLDILTISIADNGVATAMIADNAVDNSKLAQMPPNTLKGNNTGSSAAAQDVTVADIISMLGLANVLKYKGSVVTYAALPSTGNTKGDVWNVVDGQGSVDDGSNVCWNGTSWDNLGGIVDLSGYLQKSTQINKYYGTDNSGNQIMYDALNLTYHTTKIDSSLTLTDGALIAIDWSAADEFELTLTGMGHTLVAPSNLAKGTKIIYIKQDAIGGRSLNFDSIYDFPEGVAPSYAGMAANAYAIVTLVSDGILVSCVSQKNFV